MATIRTAIELEDRVSGVLNGILNTAGMTVSAVEKMNGSLGRPIEASYFDGVRDSIAQTAADMQSLSEKMNEVRENAERPIAGISADLPQPAAAGAPVQWQSDSLNVFSDTGAERFTQELQSAEAMLHKISECQLNIAANSEQTSVFPAAMTSDMQSMQTRITAIQKKVQEIGAKPIELVTAADSAMLEQLRGQLGGITGQQESLNAAVRAMDVGRANRAYLQLSQSVGNTERYIRDNTAEQEKFNQKIQSGTGSSDKLMNSIKRIAGAYISLQSAGQALKLSDELTQTTARLDMMNDGQRTTAELQNMILQSAQRSRGSYQATADAVAKLGLTAGDAFASSDETVAFMEQVNKQFIIAGTEASGVQAAMLQLTQAMGSGVLRGEEYNSILEQAPNIIQSIADYLDVPKGKLKDMAADGKITADVVKAAMFAAADETNAKFESMPMTFEQIWTSFQNRAMSAFQPVLERLNEIANSDNFQTFVDNAINVLSVVAVAVLNIFDAVASVGNFISQNWAYIAPVIKVIAVALGIAAIAWGVYKIAQDLANASLLACPLVWIIVLVIALVAIIYAVVDAVNKFTGSSVSATAIICGSFMAILATVGNVLIAAWNLVVDVFALIYNLVAEVANFVGNVFSDPIGSICRLFFGLADTVLGIIQALASAIDAVFGTDLAGGVQGWRDGLSGWVDDTFGKGNEIMAKMDADSMKLDRIDTQAAFDMGANFGEGIDDTLSGLGTDDLFNSDGIPGADDFSDLYGGVYNIDDNTGNIADSLSASDEELKYLRDIAERETINRFTTADITIEQTNNNNVSSDTDLDGIVNGIAEAVAEAVFVVTEGVHV